jgi:hypothetical protein
LIEVIDVLIDVLGVSCAAAGVHVRSAATLGGHFGLCDTRPLPTDLALLLAAAGAKLQVMTATAQHYTGQQYGQHQFGQQYGQQYLDGQSWQQQQPAQALDLTWMSAEQFLADSAVGQKHHQHQQQQQQQRQEDQSAAAAAAAMSTAAGGFDLLGDALLGPDCIAGAQVLQLESTCSGQQQQQPQPAGMAAGGSSSSSMRVVTAVWLPYADDKVERFWSYKLSWRHVNSHAFVNMALWLKFEPNSSSSSSRRRGGRGGDGDGAAGAVGALASQADPAFAGCCVSAARLFLGCPPVDKLHTALSAAAAKPAAAAAAVGEESWLVLRAGGVEEVLTGSTVTVQVSISSSWFVGGLPTVGCLPAGTCCCAASCTCNPHYGSMLVLMCCKDGAL